MSDETDFSPSPGDVVLDHDDDDPDRAVVVNTPQIRAEDWMVVRCEKTVAEDNPEYPPDALVAVVMYEAYIEEYADTMPDWDRKHALSITALNDKELNYYVFPYPRLAPAESESETESQPESEPPESDESSVDAPAQPALTDIKHVGESRADDLRAAGYESVGDVARADQSGLADVDGIGEARAETMSASATDLLDDQPESFSSAEDAPEKTDTDTPESRETPEADTAPSAAIVALSQYLDGDGMDAEIAADNQSVRVASADHSYRVSLDSGVEGDGPHRSQLNEAVEKVRAATQTTSE